MNILSISNLSRMGREKPLFTDVTFGLNDGDKAAVIGRNGCGKSTLLSTIAGQLNPDEGSVVINKESGVSFLPQTPLFNGSDTIEEHIFKSHSPKLDKIRRYEKLCEKMQEGLNNAEQKEFDELTQQMDNEDLWNYESQIRSTLGELGIQNLSLKMSELSGGMLKKVALAQVLVEDTKLLLLDEPTNHLDIKTIVFLQNYLVQTKRTVLMVTHDRYFLDAVCTHIYELARNRLKLYEGNYSKYLEKKETEAQIEANTERRIESVLRFERKWLLRGPCARGTKIKARIDRDMQLINRVKFEEDKGFTLQVAGRRLGGKILELHGIGKNYEKSLAEKRSSTGADGKAEHPVIRNFSYKFTKGERIGIFGSNGTGKSTLLNIITGTIEPDTGWIDVGVNTVFGYYQQNPVFKDKSLTVLEYIKEAAEYIQMNDGRQLSAAQFLNEFGFEGKIQHSMLSTLSGGELKRVFLVRLLISNPNFLILDEPTNDFDIFTLNILEDFLLGYQGCLLIVSHDRYFMDKIADTLFVMEDDGAISGFVGKCSEYIDYLEEQKKKGIGSDGRANSNRSVGLSAATSPGDSTPKPPAGKTPAPKKKRSFKEQREFEELEALILELEEKKPELEAEMAGTDFAKIQAASTQYAELTAKLDKAYGRWSELAELG